jgi:sulfide dehydrogenase [flavocytochrome c] flavoprotein subunit
MKEARIAMAKSDAPDKSGAVFSRREFGALLGGAGLVIANPFTINPAAARTRPHVVIVGGGVGGGTVAHHLKKIAPKLRVTLIEPHPVYATCFFSNLYLGGIRSFTSITHDYRRLKRLGVNVIHDWVRGISTARRRVRLKHGRELTYQRLVVSPGIDFKYGAIEGYSSEVARAIPHAWKAGAQTLLLKRLIENMDEGGVAVMTAPPEPYRCPAGPYERASMIAHYLKIHKPRAKLLIIDAKNSFSKQPLFEEGWRRHYPGMIEWLPAAMTGGGARKVDVKRREVTTVDGQKFKGVINIIPPQTAGRIAIRAGLAEGEWCPVNFADFASKKAPDVYVLGDASIAKAMPKSAFSANSQARAVASAIAADLAGKERFPPRFRNVCWSLIAPKDSVKDGADYRPGPSELEPLETFISKLGESDAVRAANYEESAAWYSSITADIFAK